MSDVAVLHTPPSPAPHHPLPHVKGRLRICSASVHTESIVRSSPKILTSSNFYPSITTPRLLIREVFHNTHTTHTFSTNACMHAYIHTYIHTKCIHTTCMHACMHACIHTYAHMYIYTYINAHPLTHTRNTHTHTCTHAHTYLFMHACIRTYIQTYIHT